MAAPGSPDGAVKLPVEGAGPGQTTPLLITEAPATNYSACEESVATITTSDEPDAPATRDKRSIIGLLAVLLLGVFVSQADSTLVLASYGQIASDFGSLQDASWLMSSYMLATCVAQPIYGKLSDIFGRHAMLQVAYTLFAVGSILGGLSRTMWQLIITRAVQGLGGAGMVSLVSIIVAGKTSVSTMAYYFADRLQILYHSETWPNTEATSTSSKPSDAPLVASLADTCRKASDGDGASLAGQGPLTILAMVLVAVNLETSSVYPHQTADSGKLNLWEKLKRVDLFGAASLSATILSLLLILDIGGQKVPWDAPVVFILAAVGIVSGTLFVVVERCWAKEPIFPLYLLSNRAVATSCLLLGLQTFSQVALMFLIPAYFQVTQNVTPSQAGALMVPSIVGNGVGALIAGAMISKYGRYKFALMLSPISSLLCFALLLVFWDSHTTAAGALLVFPSGLGTGTAFSSLFVALANGVQEKDMAIAVSGLYLSGSIGAVSGISAASAILQIGLQSSLHKALAGVSNGQEIARRASSDLTYVQGLKGKIHDLVVGAYVTSFKGSFWMCLSAAGIALVISLFAKEKRLR
ncbi:hypothetical protein S40293_02154 [Stachybotrys chartarum IBT 40293]|nr:hypothetical protein S40293_02154 [Stachybotrys chartarum IBT 40293]